MKRSPLKPGTPPERRTRLRQRSRKRQRQMRLRRRVVAEALLRDGGCVAAALVPEVECWGPLDGHEIRRRSQDPDAWLNLDLIRTVCRAHHSWLHDHPAVAVELGLLVHTEASP